MTQPIPVVVASPPRFTPSAPPAPPAPPAGRFVHRFGSVPSYLLGRFLAFALDIFGIGFVLATFGFHATDAGFLTVAGHDASGYAILLGISLGSALLLAFLCESISGTTLGKLLFALHVRRGDGGHAGAARVFVRYLLRPIDLIAIGPLLALVTPRHQRLGDFASGTVVARSRIGAFAPLVAVLALVGIGYAQIVYGGGATSALGVSAETADFAPGLFARATKIFGVPPIVPGRASAPSSGPSDAVATPAPIASGAIQ